MVRNFIPTTGKVFLFLLLCLFLYTKPVTAQTLTQSTSAAAFLDSLGVNTHMLNSQWGGSYANVLRTEQQLVYIGFRYARDSLYGHAPAAILLKMHKDIGVKFNIILRGEDYATQIADIRANSQMIAEVEGMNEPDMFPPSYNGLTSWPAAIAMQKQLYADIKSNPATSKLPVNNLTVSNADNQKYLGNLSAFADFASFHIYPQWGGPWGSFPYPSIEYAINAYAAATPGKPPIITEGGWWTKPGPGGVTETVQAKYILNFLFDAFILNIRRSYLYQLADEYPDPLGTNVEHHFGLFRNDGSPKLAATALHNLTTMLADAVIKPAEKLSYVVSGLPSTGHQLLLQKSDGTFILVLWNDTKIWDNALSKEVYAAPSQVLLSFGQQAASIKIYDPLTGTNPTNTYEKLQGLNVILRDHPVLVFISSKPTTPALTAIQKNAPTTPSTARGKSINLGFAWNAAPMTKNYSVFVHFIDASGKIVWQGDHMPSLPTSNWSGAYSYSRSIYVPPTVPPGTYRIVAGLCDPSPPYYGQTLTPGTGVVALSAYRFQTGTLTVF